MKSTTSPPQTGQSRFSIRAILAFLPAALVALAIFVMSSQHRVPTAGMNEFVVTSFGHVAMYAVLASLLMAGFLLTGKPPFVAATMAVMFAVSYGFIDEFHQMFVAGRQASAEDIGFDLIGALLAVIFWFRMRKHYLHSQTQP